MSYFPWEAAKNGNGYAVWVQTVVYGNTGNHNHRKTQIRDYLKGEKIPHQIQEDDKKGTIKLWVLSRDLAEAALLRLFSVPYHDIVVAPERRNTVCIVRRVYSSKCYQARFTIYEAVKSALTALGQLGRDELYDAVTNVTSPVIPTSVLKSTQYLSAILIHALDMDEIDWLEIVGGRDGGKRSYRLRTTATKITPKAPPAACERVELKPVPPKPAAPLIQTYVCPGCKGKILFGKTCLKCEPPVVDKTKEYKDSMHKSNTPPNGKPLDVKKEIQCRVQELQKFVADNLPGASIKCIVTYSMTEEFLPS